MAPRALHTVQGVVMLLVALESIGLADVARM